jgi:diguanylate cyclase (GGDEF)-like protein/PAS domain S-box-containing protein
MPQLSIYLLGPLQVRLGDVSITRAFRTEKERALLAFLAVEGARSHSRDVLAELFWPDRPEGVGRTNLRQALTGLRKTLGDRQHEMPLLLADDESIRINPDREIWLDVAAFRAQYQATLVHNHPSLERCPACAQNLGKLVDLYRDDFLVEFSQVENPDYQEWIVFHREHYYSNLLVAMGSLVAYHRVAGDLESARLYARRYVSIAPLEENAHRQMMEILALSGRRSAAIEQYQLCRRLLADELAIEPSPETQALYEYIKNGSKLSPSISTPKSEPRELPQPMTTFVGRQKELDWFEQCLPNPVCRLITLVGLPGVGKTRLVLQAASLKADLFKDGVHFVPLESVHSVDQLFASIAKVLDIPLHAGEKSYSKVMEYLRPLHALLVLDHLEHLMDGTGPLLDLLKNSPHLKLLVTTQRRLDYQAACIYHVQGLDYPQSWDEPQAAEYPAVELFIARSARSHSSFQLNQENLPHVVRITQLAHGLPLAIELAAARTRDYSVQHIAERMAEGLDILSTTQLDVPARHRSLQAAFGHSNDMLSEVERSLLHKLSVFEAPITPQAAEAITTATIADLAELSDRSLLNGDATHGYYLHPLLKRYAARQLAALPAEREVVLESYCRYFLDYLFAREGDLANRRKAYQATIEIGGHLIDVYAALERVKQQHDEALFSRSLDVLRRYFETCAARQDRRCSFWKVELALLDDSLDLQWLPVPDRTPASQEHCCGRMACLESAKRPFILEDANQHILEVNLQACQLTGYTRSELLAMQTSDWEPSDLHDSAQNTQQFESLLERADGSRIPVEITHTRFNLENEVYYLSVLQADPQEGVPSTLVKAQRTHDPLTGLPNRAEFLEIVRLALSRAARKTSRLAVLLTDIDQLSTINKTHGYEAGNSILITVADRLRESLRSDDVVARVSGDAFGVLLDPVFKIEHAASVARKMQDGLNGSYALDGKTITLSFTIGICIYPEGGDDAESLLSYANKALREAKDTAEISSLIYPRSSG